MLKSTYKPAPAAPAPPPLLPGWTEHKAPTGHTYYYNAETKKSTYQRPVALPEPVQPQPPVHQPYGQNAFPGAPFQAGFPPQYQQQFPVPHHGGRGGFRGGHGYQDRRRHQPEDRPKHKHAIPGCAPWVLVKTKLRRRFVHNPETKESLWKFPPDVMKGVVEFDRNERDKKERKERGEPSDVEDEQAAAAAELAAADEREGSGARPSVKPVPAPKDYDSEEYEEVEVTDDEEEEEEDGPSKRQKTGEEGEEGVEFDEDDIAWQLQAMGEDYGLDPGEYGDVDEDLPEGAEGLPLTEEDAKALFRDLLDDHNCNPFSTWDKIIDEGRIIDDDRYTALSTMKARKETWEEWSRDKVHVLKEQRDKSAKEDPAIPYLAFLHKYATPKLYWPEFRRKYKKEAEMKNPKLLDKDREKWYREHISRLKLPESTRKSDLSNLLKSLPVTQLNRSTSMVSLPSVLLRDLRFISLPVSVRDPMVEAYISTLPPPPEASNQSSEELEEAERKKQDRERREKALADRERRVQEEKRRQQRDLAYGKGRLREEEEELRRAMKVGKEGLRAQLGDLEEKDGEKEGEKAE